MRSSWKSGGITTRDARACRRAIICARLLGAVGDGDDLERPARRAACSGAARLSRERSWSTITVGRSRTFWSMKPNSTSCKTGSVKREAAASPRSRKMCRNSLRRIATNDATSGAHACRGAALGGCRVLGERDEHVLERGCDLADAGGRKPGRASASARPPSSHTRRRSTACGPHCRRWSRRGTDGCCAARPARAPARASRSRRAACRARHLRQRLELARACR